jgi:hypothetical protein
MVRNISDPLRPVTSCGVVLTVKLAAGDLNVFVRRPARERAADLHADEEQRR